MPNLRHGDIMNTNTKKEIVMSYLNAFLKGLFSLKLNPTPTYITNDNFLDDHLSLSQDCKLICNDFNKAVEKYEQKNSRLR